MSKRDLHIEEFAQDIAPTAMEFNKITKAEGGTTSMYHDDLPSTKRSIEQLFKSLDEQVRKFPNDPDAWVIESGRVRVERDEYGAISVYYQMGNIYPSRFEA